MVRKFIETPEFQNMCKRLKVSDQHIRTLQQELLDDPKKGDLIVGTGGARKIRLGNERTGKSGGFRILYTDFSTFGLIFFWIIISKSDADNINSEEKKFIKNMNAEIKNTLNKKGSI